MKPTELQIDAVSEAVRHLTAGHHYAEAFINQWEAIRPPDPALTRQAEEIDLLRKNCDSAWQAHTNLLRDYHALHDAFSKFKSPDPKPTAEEIEREAFIEWAESEGLPLEFRNRDFTNTDTAISYRAWKAARNQTPQP